MVALNGIGFWPSPNRCPSLAACATRSPSGLSCLPFTAGQNSPFSLPASLVKLCAYSPAGFPS